MTEMKTFDHIYRDLVNDIIENGVDQDPNHTRAKYADGSPAPTRAIEGVLFKITPEMGVPRLRSKFVGGKWALTELEWIMQAQSNRVSWLHEHGGVTVWDEWELADGTIGSAYGNQVKTKTVPVAITTETANPVDLAYMKRHRITTLHKNLDQMSYALYQLRTEPWSRSIMISLWSPSELPKMALRPCVWTVHFSVFNGKLNLHVKQRSCDVGIGLSFNVLQYYALKELVADELGLESGDLIWCIDNAHIYHRHMDTLKEQVDSFDYSQPNGTKLILPEGEDFFDRPLSKATFENYVHNGKYSYEVAI